MASFRPKFQISGVKFIKESYNPSILLRSGMITCIGPNVDARSFWFWKKKSNMVEYGSGNCGLPSPPRIDLVCKGCESKCIEFEEMKKKKRKFFTFKKRPEPKKKPDNCKEEEKPVEEKYTLWETIFGPNPKRFWPDPCTCKLALKEKRNKRICDPRLQDSRYELTCGDVFLYTETIKSCPKGCVEPQPKSPPSYKMPRAALSKMLSSSSLTSINRMVMNQQNENKENPKHLEPCRMPYDEMRPAEKKRKAFNCLSGVRSEDIIRPLNNDFHSHKVSQQQVPEKPEILKICERARQKKEGSSDKKKTDSNEMGKKLSRIEQLKMQIKQKDMFDYNSCSPSI